MKGSLVVTGLGKSCSVSGTPARNLDLAGWKACISQIEAATKRKFITFRGKFFKLEAVEIQTDVHEGRRSGVAMPIHWTGSESDGALHGNLW
jgi:hypothetical protein